MCVCVCLGAGLEMATVQIFIITVFYGNSFHVSFMLIFCLSDYFERTDCVIQLEFLTCNFNQFVFSVFSYPAYSFIDVFSMRKKIKGTKKNINCKFIVFGSSY